MIAHIRKSDGAEQLAAQHCRNVSVIAKKNAKGVGLENAAELCGLMHDAGKFTEEFSTYLRNGGKTVYHSPIGSIYAYRKWYRGDLSQRIAAQIVSIVIRGHHGGLPDCINSDQTSPYLNCIEQDEAALHFEQAISNYTEICASEKELSDLFERACLEITKLCSPDRKGYEYRAGMVARFILSCVVDADRWDSACFENNENPFADAPLCNWKLLSEKLETYLSEFKGESPIDKVRRDISAHCRASASQPKGLYTLTAPTGGGKTLSSLRFSLNHLIKNDMRRILYVIPYNTILEQNSTDIREALNGYDGILEHFGDFVADVDEDESECRESRHKLLTERWDSPIILTSMVQFLNCVYKGSNTNSRRFCRLANSVIVFDEIQALPKKCTVMFERAVRFLVEQLGCSVLMCTATQPLLRLQDARPLMPADFSLRTGKQLCRVNISAFINQVSDNCSYETAAQRLVQRAEQYKSVLMIVNTKKVAAEVFTLAAAQLPDNYLKIHLSTSMAPAHRAVKISQMKEFLESGKPVFCVSTALIEAGVNISFPCVIRSLTGLPSIIQSAGRCNRHMELGIRGGNVEVWYLGDERLTSLPEISGGRDMTKEILRQFKEITESEEQMQAYFALERERYKRIALYPYKATGLATGFLSQMIADNAVYKSRCRLLRRDSSRLAIYQAFSEVGKNFEVIDEDTVSVLVPYNGSEELALALGGKTDINEKVRLIRKAQAYSVSVYTSSFLKMIKQNMAYPVADTGIYALRKEYYDDSLGIVFSQGDMEFLGY